MTEAENSRSKAEGQESKHLRSKETGYKIIREEMKRLDGISGMNTAHIPVKISGKMTRSLGICRCIRQDGKIYPGEIVISKLLVEQGSIEHLQNTVRHEYAHLYVNTRDNINHDHDYAWRMAAAKFGCDATEKSKYDELPHVNNYKYTLTCNSCKKVWRYSRKCKIVNAFMENPNTTAYKCRCCGNNSFSLNTEKTNFEKGKQKNGHTEGRT